MCGYARRETCGFNEYWHLRETWYECRSFTIVLCLDDNVETSVLLGNLRSTQWRRRIHKDKMGLVMDIPRKRGWETHTRKARGRGRRVGEERIVSLAYFTSVTKCTHCVTSSQEDGDASGRVYASGLIVLSSTVLCYNTIGYSSVYIPRLQSTLETSMQTSWSAVVDYGNARRVSNPEARDIEHTVGEGWFSCDALWSTTMA